MTRAEATLHLVCGKAASGKTSLALKLAETPQTLYLSEDQWLSTLYGEQMRSLADYVSFSAKLQQAMTPLVVDVLRSGVSVVLDFPANTKDRRRWMAGLAVEAGCACQLHLLDVSDAVCKARLAVRNASGTHPFSLSDEQFDRLARYFERPEDDEGFDVTVHTAP